jgi:hypothetical protein
MKLAIVPSNQHHNVVAGDPNPALGITTEEMIAVIRANEAMAEVARQGYTGYLAYIPGAGSYNIDELVRMLDLMVIWRPDFVLSFHSDASGPQDVYPLMVRSDDLAWATKIGKNVAGRIGFATQTPKLRTDLTFTTHTKSMPVNHSILLEIGVHGATAGPVYGMAGTTALWKYARFHGLMALRGFLQECGLLVYDGIIPADVDVPPGFEKWHDEIPPVTPPTPTNPPPIYTRLLKVANPYMHGNDVLWVQKQLIHTGHLPAQTSTGYYNSDGIYGKDTAAAVLAFQKMMWKTTPSEWDGKVGPKTWAKLLTV